MVVAHYRVALILFHAENCHSFLNSFHGEFDRSIVGQLTGLVGTLRVNAELMFPVRAVEMAGAAILRRSGLPAVKVVESRRILHEAFKGPVAAGSKIHGGSPPFLFWAQKKRRPCLPDWEKRTPPCGVSIRFFQVYLSMTDVPCNLVAALVSGVRYSQGSGAYQSSVRNRSKLVVNSVGKPANMLVNQGFGGIIENFHYKHQAD